MTKLGERRKARRAARQARRSTDRKVVQQGLGESVDTKSAEESGNNAAIRKMVDKTNNGNSLMENFNYKYLESNKSIKPELKVEEDVQMQRKPTDHSFTNKEDIRKAIAKSRLTAYRDKESSALENIYQAKSIEGQKNSNIKVLNAWNAFNTDPKNNLMLSEKGFSHGGNVFKRDAEGRVTYRTLLDAEKGEYGVEQPLRTLGKVGIDEMYREQRRKKASRFSESIAGKTHAIESGGIYDKKTGKVTNPTAAGGNAADYYFSGLRAGDDYGGIKYTKGGPLEGREYKMRPDDKPIIGRK